MFAPLPRTPSPENHARRGRAGLVGTLSGEGVRGRGRSTLSRGGGVGEGALQRFVGRLCEGLLQVRCVAPWHFRRIALAAPASLFAVLSPVGNGRKHCKHRGATGMQAGQRSVAGGRNVELPRPRRICSYPPARSVTGQQSIAAGQSVLGPRRFRCRS